MFCIFDNAYREEGSNAVKLRPGSGPCTATHAAGAGGEAAAPAVEPLSGGPAAIVVAFTSSSYGLSDQPDVAGDIAGAALR